tara:strand:+ start:68 stop:541 length:474 start_codon:yes stop_codon:yes gene_type:complete
LDFRYKITKINRRFNILFFLVLFSFIFARSSFGVLPILKLSIEFGQSNTSLGSSLSYGLAIGRDNSDDWIDGSYGLYWSKTVSLKNLENYKTSYGLVIGNHISHIKFGTKKMFLDKNKFNGFELQPVLFTILSSNFSFYKKDESNKRLLGLGFGFGL